MKTLEAIVAGRSVALVGNAVSLLEQGKAAEIDAHDVVIRMNLGIPSRIQGVGDKTTIWCLGQWWENTPAPADCASIVWMKRTALGARHLPNVRRDYLHIPVVEWPKNLEAEARDFVGASPGTGVRMLYWLKRHAAPASVSVYGMDCWVTGTSWKDGHSRFHWDHKPDLERRAIKRLLENA